VTIRHSPAFTAPEIAESAHIAGSSFAKTVIVKLDGDLAMVVLPANRHVDLFELQDMMLSNKVELASEAEFNVRFPDCEPGAMPPFGNLYGLPVYIAQPLTEASEIAFNAGTHHEVMKMLFEDYASLVNPTVLDAAII
jgi:Ala-tRNA(Pro) deacylase